MLIREFLFLFIIVVFSQINYTIYFKDYKMFTSCIIDIPGVRIIDIKDYQKKYVLVNKYYLIMMNYFYLMMNLNS